MPILEAELKVYRSAVIADGGTNGGRMSNTEVISATLSNLFPPVSQAERTAGSTKWRKMFLKVANDADLPLINPKLFIDYNTPGNDRFTVMPATQTDTQAAIPGSPTLYGSGVLNTSVGSGAASVDVLVENGATVVFHNGDLIRISDKADVNAVGGNEEYGIINGVPSVVGNVVTLVLTAVTQNGYSNTNTRVSAVLTQAEIRALISNLVVTTAGDGDYNPTFLTADAIGSIEQQITITFTSATTFNVVGDTLGALGGGTISGGFSPNNPAFTKPYFVLLAAGFSGTWANGDTLVFQTHPAAMPVWVRRVVPAASAANANNICTMGWKGETA